MELKGYKTEADYFTKAVSDLIRQLAFAGIAIIWIFKISANPNDKLIVNQPHLIPNELLLPLFFLVMTLVFELLQFLIPAIIYTLYFREEEKKNNNNTTVNVTAPIWYTYPGYTFWGLKIISLVTGYYFILTFITSKL
jgi:hypothetical protein